MDNYQFGLTRRRSKSSIFGSESGVICGECEYCDAAREGQIKFNERPGTVFCKTRQIKYETLKMLGASSFDKYILTTGVLGEVTFEEDGLGDREIKSDKKVSMITIPTILAEILYEFRKAHESEMLAGENFLTVVSYMNVRNLKLNHLLDLLILQDLRKDHCTQPGQVKAVASLKQLNAFELFSLLIIFLNRLPTPIWPVNEECGRLLLKLSSQLPDDIATVAEDKRRLLKCIFDKPVEENTSMEEIDSIIHDLFHIEKYTRLEMTALRNKFLHSFEKNMKQVRPHTRKSILHVVVRMIRFEVVREVYKFIQARHNPCAMTLKERQVLFDSLLAQEIANIAVCCGPVMMRLPDDIDTRENRIRTTTSLLYHFDGSVMYRYEKHDSQQKTMSCHTGCSCGFGEQENFNDPAFRQCFLGAPLFPYRVKTYAKKAKMKKRFKIQKERKKVCS